MPEPLLIVDQLAKTYRLPRESLLAPAPALHALQGVSFTLQAGRSLGIVGESGSGKSTLARLVMALERPSAGRVVLDGQDLHALTPAELRRARAKVQMVFQDPYGSLDPRRTVMQTVAEPLALLQGAGRAEQLRRAAEALEAVGLRQGDLAKYPHEFSGGQRQRIAIARALITRPRLIVADEPVSALDVSVQAQVLNLMQDLQDGFGVTYLFISHDLSVIDLVCDEVIVLKDGRIVEQGDPDTMFRAAQHPYTRRLLAAVPGRRFGASAQNPAHPELSESLAHDDDPPPVVEACRRCGADGRADGRAGGAAGPGPVAQGQRGARHGAGAHRPGPDGRRGCRDR
jgi:peptide/nickel transport system ATP-binding protein